MIVIADDITGAAEIAGLAFSRGQQVRLVCDALPPESIHAHDTLTVVATDTRSMTAAEATAATRRLAMGLPPPPMGRCLFKKTDSALRGHVVAELSALMEATGYRRAVFLGANPSRGRIIDHGTYYIEQPDDCGALHRHPLHTTAFSYDPEFPAHTSVLAQRFPDAARHHILLPDAISLDDIRRVVSEHDDGTTLFAGAADLFEVVAGYDDKVVPPSPPLPLSSSLLILCGSTQSKPLDIGIATSAMPETVKAGKGGIDQWKAELLHRYHDGQRHALILTIPPQPHGQVADKATAARLRGLMATAARLLCTVHQPQHLVVEGGATAWATLQALDWQHFDIVGHIAPGVVQMRAPGGTIVTLKPGSYPWGGLFG